MAPNDNGIRDDMPSTADGDGAIAAAVQDQLPLVASFERWLAQKVEVDGNRNGITAKIRLRLDSYKRWLLEVEHTTSNLSEDIEPWTMDARAQSGNDDESVIVVNGPGSGEPIKIPTKDRQEFGYLMSDSYLGYMMKICHAFAKAQDTMRSLLHATNELEEETSHLSQPPETTVKTYIRRLQEYNDMKDIGQQLIGLIAENRGVPIRTLYEQGEFGVSFPQ